MIGPLLIVAGATLATLGGIRAATPHAIVLGAMLLTLGAAVLIIEPLLGGA